MVIDLAAGFDPSAVSEIDGSTRDVLDTGDGVIDQTNELILSKWGEEDDINLQAIGHGE
ncbi:MAG: hypothetical protein ACRBB0_11405 [Pelagimonas sp.]|uniref:hypothetical protein n=1 Tax=Pelagimonas sp. TaxID=2073170 RepID=UPI003D6AEBE7